MSNLFNINSFLIVFINLFNLFLTNYIHEELNGNLVEDKSSNFSLFIKHFTGIIFYAIDENNNKILIELEDHNNEKQIIFKFNRYYVEEKSKNLCNCHQCSDVYITIILHLKENYITMQCNNQRKILNINKSKIYPDQLNSYPIPKEFGERSNRTFIWMGNIGYYIGKHGMEYEPLRNQLVGCLDKLYFNGKLIKIKSNGPKLNSSCLTRYDERICMNNVCSNSSVSYNIADCSINVLNGRYCIKNKNQLNQTISNKILKLNGETILTRIEWLMNSVTVTNLCLAEFTFDNGFVVFVYINNYQNLILTKGDFQNSPPVSEYLKVLSLNTTHIMIVYINKTEFTIRLSSGEKIDTSIFTIHGSLSSVKVGTASKYGLCNEFNGLMDFQYKIIQNSQSRKWSTEFRKISSQKNKNEDNYMKVTKHPIEKNKNTVIKSIYKADKNEISAATITLITCVLVLFFIFILTIFYIIIRKEMRSSMKRICLTPNNSIIRNRSMSRSMPLPNIYEYEDPTRCSDFYETIDN